MKERRLKLYLVRQAIVVPIGAMLIPIFIASTLPGYSSISQHISEVALLDHPIAMIQRICAIAAGISILLFGIGLVLVFPRTFGFTVAAVSAFAVSMVSNGVFVMGSPLHGLYGLGLFMALAPAFFAAEFPRRGHHHAIVTLSMAAAVFNLGYMWLILSGFDPDAYRGLTQRLATIVIFGWYAFAGRAVLREASMHQM